MRTSIPDSSNSKLRIEIKWHFSVEQLLAQGKRDTYPLKNVLQYLMNLLTELLLQDEKKIQEDRQFKGIGLKEKEMKGEGDKNEEEDAFTPRKNVMLGLCAVCHLTLGSINPNFNHNIPCSQGHALCQRCVQHFTIQIG